MRVGFFISSLSGGGAEKVLITIAQSMADNNIGSVSITSLGCLFEVGNAEALAKAIDSVVSNISEFNPNWIRENAYNRFSIQVMTSALLNVYKG